MNNKTGLLLAILMASSYLNAQDTQKKPLHKRLISPIRAIPVDPPAIKEQEALAPRENYGKAIQGIVGTTLTNEERNQLYVSSSNILLKKIPELLPKQRIETQNIVVEIPRNPTSTHPSEVITGMPPDEEGKYNWHTSESNFELLLESYVHALKTNEDKLNTPEQRDLFTQDYIKKIFKDQLGQDLDAKHLPQPHLPSTMKDYLEFQSRFFAHQAMKSKNPAKVIARSKAISMLKDSLDQILHFRRNNWNKLN